MTSRLLKYGIPLDVTAVLKSSRLFQIRKPYEIVKKTMKPYITTYTNVISKFTLQKIYLLLLGQKILS